MISNHRRGVDNGRAKLNEKQVKEMLDLYGKLSIRMIAAKYKVGITTVKSIRTGKTWGHVTGIIYRKRTAA